MSWQTFQQGAAMKNDTQMHSIEAELHAAVHEGRDCAEDNASRGQVLRFELVNAYLNPEIAGICYEKKLACYSRFRAAAAAVPLAENSAGGHLHIVTATDCESGEIVGGVSIYRRGAASRLPVERAIGGLEVMEPEIASWRGRHVVELSGLWVDESLRKTGTSEQLMLVAFAASHELKADRIVGFSHQHVLGFYGTVGLVPVPTLGTFSYPNPDYVSTVVWGDPAGFSTLPAPKKQAVIDYAEAMASRQPLIWREHRRARLRF